MGLILLIIFGTLAVSGLLLAALRQIGAVRRQVRVQTAMTLALARELRDHSGPPSD